MKTEAEEIAYAVTCVREKPDSRYCSPGRWRVYSCPLTAMVVIERAKPDPRRER